MPHYALQEHEHNSERNHGGGVNCYQLPNLLCYQWVIPLYSSLPGSLFVSPLFFILCGFQSSACLAI
uniref:Uncharacterized protein n=1 Tax=Arion vulgaris TaxID=1028688 RepID=A0A0B6ZD23_9EUPU